MEEVGRGGEDALGEEGVVCVGEVRVEEVPEEVHEVGGLREGEGRGKTVHEGVGVEEVREGRCGGSLRGGGNEGGA